MTHHAISSRNTLALAAAIAGLVTLPGRSARAQEHATHARESGVPAIPASMRAEHQEIDAAATKASGRTGVAARALAKLLHPHFVREEQIALPPLGLLLPLSRGEATAGMRAILPLTDSLRAELPRMLEEHKAIRAATLKMGQAARREGNARVARLATQLAQHAKSEEEMFYPAAILVGDLVRAKVLASSLR